MQLFGILLVLNRKSRLGRQHSRTSGASRVRGAVQWPFKSRYCLTCSMSGDRWRWGGSDDRRIRKEGKKSQGKASDAFFSIYQAFFHKSPTTTSSKSFCLPPYLRAYSHTRARRVTRITVECTAKCIWLQTDKQIQFDTHAVYTVHTKSFTELHSAQQGFWNSEMYIGWLTLV